MSCAGWRRRRFRCCCSAASTWDPQWSTRNPLAVDAPVLDGRGSASSCGTRELGAAGPQRRRPDLVPSGLAGHLALGPAQVQRAVDAARTSAQLRDGHDHRRGSATRRTRPERRRAGTACSADRAGGRLGRPGAGAERTPRARRARCSRAASGHGYSQSGGCAGAEVVAGESRHFSLATRAPGRPCRRR